MSQFASILRDNNGERIMEPSDRDYQGLVSYWERAASIRSDGKSFQRCMDNAYMWRRILRLRSFMPSRSF